MRKTAILGSIALFLSPISKAADIVREGRCMYIMENGRKTGEMCSAAKPVSMEEMTKRMSSLNIEKLLKDSGMRAHYGGFETSTLIKAIISVENSSVDPDAISQAGAVGLMQLMPETAALTEYELRNPEKNLLVGIRHFDCLYNRHSIKYGKDAIRFALAEYLVGKSNLEKVINGHRVRNWKELENVVDMNMRNLSDSNGTTVVSYTERIISNYFKLKKGRKK